MLQRKENEDNGGGSDDDDVDDDINIMMKCLSVCHEK